jgi:DNA-binding NtrC family response regulator
VVLSETDTIGLEEFPQIASQVVNKLAGHSAASAPADASAVPAEFDQSALVPVAFDSGIPVSLPQTALPPGDALPLLDAEGEVRPLEEIEGELIRYAITHYRGQMSEVARRLQIGRSTLYRKLEALGLAGERTEPAG